MGVSSLGSRAVIGTFYKKLAQSTGAKWVEPISMLMDSDQDSETYNWLGQSPAMQEWVGGRNAKGFNENGITIENKHYEATIDILIRHLRRDKSGQVLRRIAELAQRTNSHWASLLSTLLINANSTVCYDGQFFYDTDHEEGDSGTQSNDISTDISTLPATVHGTITQPSIEEAQQVIMKSVAQLLSFKDDRGEPMNEGETDFLVMVPTGLFLPFTKALSLPVGTGVSEQNVPSEMNISVAMNSRLTAASSVHTFAIGGEVSPFIRQQETLPKVAAKDETSEYAFDNDAIQIGIDAWRNTGYGYWQKAVLNELT